jgi:hypothetical protein
MLFVFLLRLDCGTCTSHGYWGPPELHFWPVAC